MQSPYTLIEGKQMKKKPDFSKLDSLEKSYKLDSFVWILNQTPDKEGNIAVFKEELDRMELEDNVSEFLGEYDVEFKENNNNVKKIILFMSKEITKKYFDVIMSEEVYCRTEEEIIDQLERMYK